MLFAIGWVVVRSSREAYEEVAELPPSSDQLDALERLDERTDRADEQLFDALQAWLSTHEPPDLDWHFRRAMNNHRGLLHVSSSRNHRSDPPTVIELLRWLAEHGPGSFGLVHVHDDEHATNNNQFRVWRLHRGIVEELDDPFLSPISAAVAPDW